MAFWRMLLCLPNRSSCVSLPCSVLSQGSPWPWTKTHYCCPQGWLRVVLTHIHLPHTFPISLHLPATLHTGQAGSCLRAFARAASSARNTLSYPLSSHSGFSLVSLERPSQTTCSSCPTPSTVIDWNINYPGSCLPPAACLPTTTARGSL